jgi:hypothetical protein
VEGFWGGVGGSYDVVLGLLAHATRDAQLGLKFDPTLRKQRRTGLNRQDFLFFLSPSPFHFYVMTQLYYWKLRNQDLLYGKIIAM